MSRPLHSLFALLTAGLLLGASPKDTPSPVRKTKEPAPSVREAAVPESFVLYQQDGIAVTGSLSAKSLRLEIDNQSESPENFLFYDFSVNDCCIPFSERILQVRPGQKRSQYLLFPQTAFRNAGIDRPERIEFSFFSRIPQTEEGISPRTVRLETVSVPEQFSPVLSGPWIYDSGGVRISFAAEPDCSAWGTVGQLVIQNNTGSELTVRFQRLWMEDTCVEPHLVYRIPSGKYLSERLSLPRTYTWYRYQEVRERCAEFLLQTEEQPEFSTGRLSVPEKTT